MDHRSDGVCSAGLERVGCVFAGYGSSSASLGWDDFKGVDVTGKVVLVLVNQPTGPPFPDDDMLYEGRWMYKFEEARRRGATNRP